MFPVLPCAFCQRMESSATPHRSRSKGANPPGLQPSLQGWEILQSKRGGRCRGSGTRGWALAVWLLRSAGGGEAFQAEESELKRGRYGILGFRPHC